MAAPPGYGPPSRNPFTQNYAQPSRQYSANDLSDSYESRNASSVPLAAAGPYDEQYTPPCEYYRLAYIRHVVPLQIFGCDVTCCSLKQCFFSFSL